MRARSCLVACLTLSVAACGTVPMAAITSNGRIFRGTFTVGIPSTFRITDGRVSCSGRLPPIVASNKRAFTLVMACNHGLTGIVIFNDLESSQSGGTLRLSDGTAGTFITGDGAAAL